MWTINQYSYINIYGNVTIPTVFHKRDTLSKAFIARFLSFLLLLIFGFNIEIKLSSKYIITRREKSSCCREARLLPKLFMCLGFSLLSTNQIHFKFQSSIYLALRLIYTTTINYLTICSLYWYVARDISIKKSHFFKKITQIYPYSHFSYIIKTPFIFENIMVMTIVF